MTLKIVPRKLTKTDNSIPFRLNGGVWWIPDIFLIKNNLGIKENLKIKIDIIICGIWIHENKIPEDVMKHIQKYKDSNEDV